MKRIIVLLLAACLFTGVSAQAQPKTLKKVMELKMPKTKDDDMPGTRGASVVWHPVQKKYYANFAGNAGFPSAVFDAAGKKLSNDDATTLVDTRGMWYNPVTKAIEGNQYSDYGWFRYKLNGKGMVNDYTTIYEGMVQPSDQSVGVLNTKRKQVSFLIGAELWFYGFNDTNIVSKFTIHFGVSKAKDIFPDEEPTASPAGYNYTASVYTGITNAEYGFLNTENKQIELYSEQTGLLTRTLKLPETAATESSFNFAYANGIYWLFDIENRKWVGYK